MQPNEDATDVRLFDPIRIFGIRLNVIRTDTGLPHSRKNGQKCYRSIFPVAAAHSTPDDSMSLRGSAEADEMHSNSCSVQRIRSIWHSINMFDAALPLPHAIDALPDQVRIHDSKSILIHLRILDQLLESINKVIPFIFAVAKQILILSRSAFDL